MLQMHVHRFVKGGMAVTDRDDRFLEEAPRLFAIVADPEDDGHPCIVAWGHELPEQTVVSWRLSNGASEVAIFKTAEAALATAELLYPSRLLYAPAPLAFAPPDPHA
jgi:hypothetical protein